MAISLFVPESAHGEVRVSIENTIYYFNYKYSTREDSWYLSIYDVNKNILYGGVKVCFGVAVSKNWKGNPFNGNLYVVRTKKSNETLSRNNFGQGKLFELMLLSPEEEEQAI